MAEVQTGVLFKMRKKMKRHFNQFSDNISAGGITFVFQHNCYKFTRAVSVFCWNLQVEQPCQAGGLCNPN